jgi:hypothetical protein
MKTIKVFGREVPLKKDGTINETFLKKEEREILKQAKDKHAAKKKEQFLQELEKLFS